MRSNHSHERGLTTGYHLKDNVPLKDSKACGYRLEKTGCYFTKMWNIVAEETQKSAGWF